MPSMRSRLFILATCIAACSGSPPSSVNAPPAPCAATPPSATGVVTHVWVHGKGLEGNRLGDSPDRSVHVYLPPSYFGTPCTDPVLDGARGVTQALGSGRSLSA